MAGSSSLDNPSSTTVDAASVNAAGAVMEIDYNAQTIMVAVADNTPLPVTVDASRFVGRKATGDAGVMTVAEALTLLSISGTNTGDEVAATTAVAGVVERSDSAENVTGTSDVVTPTVAGTKEMIDTHAGGAAFEEIGYDTKFHFPAGCGGTASTMTAVVNRIYYFPVEFHSPHTFTRIGVHIMTAQGGALARIGLYTGASGIPATKVLDAGTVDCSTTGQKLINISEAIIPGVYFFAVVCDTGSVAFRRIDHLDGGARAVFYTGATANSNTTMFYWETGTGNVLPSTPTLNTSTGVNSTPNVFIQEF